MSVANLKIGFFEENQFLPHHSLLDKSGYSVWCPDSTTPPDLIVGYRSELESLPSRKGLMTFRGPYLPLDRTLKYGYQLRNAINRSLCSHSRSQPLDATGKLLLRHYLLYYLHQQHYQRLDLREVCYIEAQLHYSRFYLPDGSFLTFRVPIRELSSLLAPYDFVRSHRSYLVNLQQVDHFDFSNHQIRLGSFTVPMSRGYRKEMRQLAGS